MSETTNLKLFKHDNPSTNTNLFDVERVLNENWDKIDEDIGKKIYYYDNVQEMKNDEGLKEGMVCKTLGYYEANDGGSGLYQIVDDDELVDDGGSIHDLVNGLKSKLIITNGNINVRQFGAKGDGVTNDSNAIKKALLYNKNQYTRVYFGDDTFCIGGIMLLYSNTHIDLGEATILNNNEILYFLNSVENLGEGYGTLKNITIENGTIDGNKNRVLFGLLHCENLNVKNVNFIDASDGSHIFDFGGCNNMEINNCNFIGTYYTDTSADYRELIQLDYATYVGMPYWVSAGLAIESDVGYDNLECKNIKIINCVFDKGNDENSSSHNAIGAHAKVEGHIHSNILIKNCEFHDYKFSCIRAMRMSDIKILNNKFYTSATFNDNRFMIEIDNNVLNNQFIPAENVYIENNEIYLENDATNGIFLHILGWEEGYTHNNIFIKNNTYSGVYERDNESLGYSGRRFCTNIFCKKYICIREYYK